MVATGFGWMPAEDASTPAISTPSPIALTPMAPNGTQASNPFIDVDQAHVNRVAAESSAPPPGYGQFTAKKDDKDKTVEDYMEEFEQLQSLNEMRASAANGRDPRLYTSKGARALGAIFRGSAEYGSSTAEGRAEGIDKAQDDFFTILNPLNWILDQQQVKDPGETGGELGINNGKAYVVGKTYRTSDGLEWKFTGISESRTKTGQTVKQNKFDYVGDSKKNKEIADRTRALDIGGASNQKKTGWGFK